MLRAPESPLVEAADCIDTEPDETLEPSPEVRDRSPPAPLFEEPADMLISPPSRSPLEAPPEILTAPPLSSDEPAVRVNAPASAPAPIASPADRRIEPPVASLLDPTVKAIPPALDDWDAPVLS